MQATSTELPDDQPERLTSACTIVARFGVAVKVLDVSAATYSLRGVMVARKIKVSERAYVATIGAGNHVGETTAVAT